MPTTTAATSDEARIRACIDEVAQAIRAKDLDALMPHYAADAVIFDLMPLQTLGRDAYRKNFQSWFVSVSGDIEFEIRDLRIALREDTAFGHYTSRVRCTRTSGARTDYQVRVTAGLRKLDGRWLITHEHISLPFAGPEAMQAALASGSAGGRSG
jgi:uncharacterized protein (TIGR02246 family)